MFGHACVRAAWLLAFALLLPPAHAQEDEEPSPPREKAPGEWSGEVELGSVTTSGNTDTTSVNASALFKYLSGPWHDEIKLEVLKSTSEGETTAESYLAGARSAYWYTARKYSFVTARYEEDRFSGYDYQVVETVGYGRKVIDRPVLSLDLEAGVGGRHSQPEDGSERRDVAIVRAAGKLEWAIGESSRFTEDLFIESSYDNTYTESETALKSKINGNLAMKLSVLVQHNSEVPEGTEHTDTTTAVTLVYDF